MNERTFGEAIIATIFFFIVFIPLTYYWQKRKTSSGSLDKEFEETIAKLRTAVLVWGLAMTVASYAKKWFGGELILILLCFGIAVNYFYIAKIRKLLCCRLSQENMKEPGGDS